MNTYLNMIEISGYIQTRSDNNMIRGMKKNHSNCIRCTNKSTVLIFIVKSKYSGILIFIA